jgi:hypothetical protein
MTVLLDVGTGRADPADYLDRSELRGRYESYCRRQAARLVQMMPRDAVRPLYRQARAEAVRNDALTDTGESDPLALLVLHCRSILPLPPFDVWLDDLRRNPDGHFSDLEESMDGPTAATPSTMEARPLVALGRPWTAHLESFREAGLWRGFISFHEDGSGRAHRTAAVFCEPGPRELRERFLTFENAALEAFLRSALP